MKEAEQGARERILAAAVNLLQAADDPESVTMREIAAQAGVAVGAINYHFRSKELLLNEAVQQIFSRVAATWYVPSWHKGQDPVTRLRRLVMETAKTAMRYRKLALIAVEHQLLEGDMTVPALVLPLLREAFQGRKSEPELRLLAFQLVATLAAAFLQAEGLRSFAEVDMTNQAQREAAIDLLIDQLIGKE